MQRIEDQKELSPLDQFNLLMQTGQYNLIDEFLDSPQNCFDIFRHPDFDLDLLKWQLRELPASRSLIQSFKLACKICNGFSLSDDNGILFDAAKRIHERELVIEEVEFFKNVIQYARDKGENKFGKVYSLEQDIVTKVVTEREAELRNKANMVLHLPAPEKYSEAVSRYQSISDSPATSSKKILAALYACESDDEELNRAIMLSLTEPEQQKSDLPPEHPKETNTESPQNSESGEKEIPLNYRQR